MVTAATIAFAAFPGLLAWNTTREPVTGLLYMFDLVAQPR